MAIFKTAKIEPINLQSDSEGFATGFVRVAGTTLSVESMGEASKVIKAEIAKHKTALFFRAKAIVADEVNSNGDFFAEEELIKSYRTFVNVPFYTNHQNDNIENARGKIIWADWIPNEKAIYVVGFVDREAYPHICRGIEEDYMRGVSMGAVNGDSLVLMADGVEKSIRHIKANDKVRTPYGNTKRVKAVHNEYLGKPMYQFELVTYHRSPLFTEDHPIWTIPSDQISTCKKLAITAARKNFNDRRMGRTCQMIGQDEWRQAEYEPQFKESATVSTGDYFLVPSKFNLTKGSAENADFFYLAGAYLGDGYIKFDKNGGVEGFAFCIGSDEIELASKLRSLLKKYSNCTPDEVLIEERNGLYIQVYDRKLGQLLLNNFGTGSKEKRIKCGLKFEEEARNLLAGYIDTDGCVVDKSNQDVRGSKFGGIQISSANIGLLEDIQSLLIALGAKSRISTADREPGANSVVKVDCIEHTLSIGSNASDLVSKSIKYANSGFGSAQIDAGKSFIATINGQKYLACPVKTVNIIDDFKEDVWDITVEDDECYVANGVSVHNCSVEYSICSLCENKASTTEEYCAHVRERKGRRFSGDVRNVRTGEVQKFKDALVYEINRGVRFIELSGVGDPACRSCRISGVFNNNEVLSGDQLMLKAASIDNELRMYRYSEAVKTASQADLDKLEQAETGVAEVITNLIGNRKNVEMDFAADLTNILADLRKSIDELTAAGLGQLQDNPVPGVAGNVPDQLPGAPGAPGAMDPAAQAMPAPGAPVPGAPGAPAMPVGQTLPGTVPAVGSITGAPNQPPVTAPRSPMPPKRGLADTEAIFNKISKIADNLRIILAKKEEDTMRHRLPSTVKEQQREVCATLKTSWKEKDSSPENNENNSMSKSGGQSMKVNAARNEAPEQITEKQLDAKNIYHPRTEEDRNQTTQKQLDPERTGKDLEQVTERQLDGKRQDNTPEQITQKQLEGERQNVDLNQTTQRQLDSLRDNKERNVVTEKQLEDSSDNGVWTRTAFQRTEVKDGAYHVARVIGALSKTAAAGKQGAEDVVDACCTMVDGLKNKTATLDAITASAKHGDVMVESLRTLVANDQGLNPEHVTYVLEAISEDKAEAVKQIASAINSELKVIAAAKNKPSKQAEIKAVFAAKKPEAVKTAAKSNKTAKATHKILTDFAELGADLSDEKMFRQAVVSFTKAAAAANNMRPSKGLEATAGVTNVDVDGQKISIAISWDQGGEEQQVDLTVDPNADLGAEPTTPEGDVTGLEPAPTTAAPAPAPSPTAGIGGSVPQAPVTAAAKNLKKTAQVPGGPGVGPNSPAGGPGSPTENMPAVPPSVDQQPGLQSLTQDEDAEEGEADKPGQYPPGSTCWKCGSKNVDIGTKDLPNGASRCNDCGIIWTTHVMVEVANPDALTTKDEEKGVVTDKPEEPSLPSMPVAASVKLNKDVMVKIAEAENKFGHVCPACGQTDCRPQVKIAGHVEYTCPACETKTDKDIMVDPANHENAELRIAWSINPKRQAVECEECKEQAKRFAAELTVQKMIKSAAENAKKSPFPKANCLERIARKWGSNAVATIGPCKGKPLADCVCQELEKLGFTSVKLMTKLANTYSQPDPMDECIADQTARFSRRFNDVKLAQSMACDTCKALFQKKAQKHHKNLLIQAWAEDFSESVLDEMDSALHPIEGEQTAEPLPPEEGDLNDPLPPVEEKVTVQISMDEAQKVVDQVEGKKTDVAADADAMTGDQAEIPAEIPAEVPAEVTDESKMMANASKEGKTMQKEAAKPTQVEHIDKGNATVPRKEQLLGDEGKAESMINKTPATPNIPRSDAKMGEESKADNFLNKGSVLPEIPSQGSASLIKGEKGTLDGEVNTQIKGTVVAGSTENLQKEAAKPSKVEHIDKGNAQIPTGKATLGDEGKDNIDVTMADPKIPTGKATMGNEGADNIDVKADLPDVATGDAKMGGEAEAQKGLPATNTQIKGTVIASGQRHRDRIAEARFKKAQMIAGRFMAAGRIKEDAYEDMVEILSAKPIDTMETYASRLFGQTKTASAQPVTEVPVLSTPIVQEASVSSPIAKDAQQELVDAIASRFTMRGVGSLEDFDRSIESLRNQGKM